jgi:hypothetical protein
MPSEQDVCEHAGVWRKRKPTLSRKDNGSWVLVAHACNPSYSVGRDQEDCSSKPAWTNSFRDPISKIPITKGLVEKVLSSSPSTTKKKTKQNKNGQWRGAIGNHGQLHEDAV